ncbi:hypothetical protein Bamb_1724 [Burkholderia ambifaria AMMD]|uniref:Uncharacterized protein n=1 Tax=Burkholderia ambifaria (strain ATCC BAA-244 / DSM 16087 / CCUG 44356 / LMG 19182 / AMMD) TaxID=339670 RepID=Q0BEZ3_BURCM|nr:hypothetical protein Bamb_1724 [Burkholderia ambifaria AMMD]
MVLVQDRARVGSRSEDWVAGAVCQYRAVSAVDGGKLRPVAFCEALAEARDNGGAQAACVRVRWIAIVTRLRRQPAGRNSMRRGGWSAMATRRSGSTGA